MQNLKPTDQLGREILIGDRVIVADCDIDGDAWLEFAYVLAVREGATAALLLEVLNAPSRRSAVARVGVSDADRVIVLARDSHEPVEQFLPTGTTFTARYLSGGSYDFVVLKDGTIQDHEGDNATMDGIDLTSLHSVVVPRVRH